GPSSSSGPCTARGALRGIGLIATPTRDPPGAACGRCRRMRLTERVLKVGLTGGIGAGKSAVAARLAANGATIIDADRIAREVVAPGTDGLREIVAAFGSDVLAPDGSLDRPALAALVFADPAARR